MGNENLKKAVLSGLFWQYFQRILGQLVSLLVSIILARLLLPEDFGVIALLGVFISVSNIFIDGGLGNALIQRKNIDELDVSSVFYTNLLVSIVLYCLIFIFSPSVALFYKMPILKNVLRVQALQIIIMAFYCVQNAILVRRMNFKINFYVNLLAVILSSIVGIIMAYLKLGVWSLVGSQLVMQLSNCFGYWFWVGWRPSFVFSFARLRSLFAYSSKILLGSLLHTLYINTYNLIIGKRYSSEQLGFYNRGQLIPTLLIDNAANTINSVMFPALSAIQDDKERFLSIVRKMVSIISFIVFFLISILLPLSSDLILLLLTDKWLPAVPFMQIVCITVCFTPFLLVNSAILTASGESSKYLRVSVLSKLMSISLIAIFSLVNIYMMVFAGSLAAIASVFVTGWWNKRICGYSTKMFLKDLSPSFLLGCINCILVSFITLIPTNSSIVSMLIGGVIGFIFYISMAFLFRFKQIKLVLSFIGRRNNN